MIYVRFYFILGIAPFKDVFWSTSEQPQNPYKNDTYEPNPDLQILISTLSIHTFVIKKIEKLTLLIKF